MKKTGLTGLFLDAMHYLISVVIVVILIYTLIQIHNHFSKNNVKIHVPKSSNVNPVLPNLPGSASRA